jgi:hypothetical protein
MSKFILAFFVAVVIAVGYGTSPAQAQPPGKSELKDDIEDLTRLDPEIERYLPRWRILEADLKIKLAQVFKLNGAKVSEADEMVVTASFQKKGSEQQILTIRVGPSPEGVMSGTNKIRSDLGDRLYQELLNRNYAHQVIEPTIPVTQQGKERIPSVLTPTIAKQFIALSAFRQAVQLGSEPLGTGTGARPIARLEHLIGNDEIGYHFWSSGQGKALLSYPIIPLDNDTLRSRGVPDILTAMLGVGYRLKIGSDSAANAIITPRRLNGALGAKAIARIEYRLPQVNDLGFSLYAEVPFAKLAANEGVDANTEVASMTELQPTKRGFDTIRGAYFLRTVAQGTVFWETWLNDYEHFFRVNLGVSYQEVQHSAVTLGGILVNPNRPRQFYGDGVQMINLIHPSEFEDWIYAKMEYLNQSGFPFGISAQLANRNLLISGFIPLVPNWLFIEAKYSTPLLRDSPAPWENKAFFMISPILRFKID